MRARVLVLPVVLALVAVSVGVGGASAHRSAKAPAKLVGTWYRAMTAADWAKVGIATEPPAHFSMLVSADGSVVMGESLDVRFTAVGSNKVRIGGVYDCGKKTALYQWSVAGGKATFTKIHDTCNYSLALFGGPWTRG